MKKNKKLKNKILNGDDDPIYFGNLESLKEKKKEDEKIFAPTSFSQTENLAKILRKGQDVLIDVSNLEKNDAIRMIDFLAGVMFALNGDMEKKENKLFLFKVGNR